MERLIKGTLPRGSQSAVVIMAGGHGTRFWPASRRRRPKQFLPLADGARTLIQATADRTSAIADSDQLLVVTSAEHLPLLAEQLPGVAFIAEPSARNTAPCVLVAALKILQDMGDVPFICLPADHYIQGNEAFIKTLKQAIFAAQHRDVLVTVGIPPTSPETGYGYILVGEALAGEADDSAGGRVIRYVEKFVEKPNQAKAVEFVANGRYLWNSGMFIWRPTVILRAIERYLPELWEGFSVVRQALGTSEQDRALQECYARITGVSIDHGVMEKVSNAVVIRSEDFSWSDVGSWSAWSDLRESIEQPADGNVTVGETVTIDAKRCAVLSTASKRLVAAVGVEDLIIVDSDDAVLVARKDRAQDVKRVVDALGEKGRLDLI